MLFPQNQVMKNRKDVAPTFLKSLVCFVCCMFCVFKMVFFFWVGAKVGMGWGVVKGVKLLANSVLLSYWVGNLSGTLHFSSLFSGGQTETE